MGLSEKLKSKKLYLVAGVIGVLILGFILLKLMASGGAEMTKEEAKRVAKTAPRAEKSISKPQKESEPAPSPLFQVLKEWKDPFKKEDQKLLDLQDKLDATKKEIELLKATLEEKKLRQEIKELEKSMTGTAQAEIVGKEAGAESTYGKQEKTESLEKISLQAILFTDEEKSALLVFGDQKCWAHEGEEFVGWLIKEIKKESVVLLKDGKTQVLFYDRSGLARQGEI